jgi:uncharacterized protein YgbK (DUF1537 family)
MLLGCIGDDFTGSTDLANTGGVPAVFAYAEELVAQARPRGAGR